MCCSHVLPHPSGKRNSANMEDLVITAFIFYLLSVADTNTAVDTYLSINRSYGYGIFHPLFIHILALNMDSSLHKNLVKVNLTLHDVRC